MKQSEDYTKVDCSASILTANLLALVTGGLPALILTALYFTLWPGRRNLRELELFDGNPFLLIVLLIGGVVVHELLHGLTWQALSDLPPGSVKYGFKWKAITPYAHSKAPMKVGAYRWGVVMPGLLLGLAPALLGLVLGSGALVAFGAFFTFAAGGDVFVLWLLRDAPEEALVEDHPSRVGCYLLFPRRAE